MVYDEPYIRIFKSLSYGYHNPRKFHFTNLKKLKICSYKVSTLTRSGKDIGVF